jgi:hypothetical protein
MKNTLAENMMRFGTKNLSELNRNVVKQLLMEAAPIDLLTLPGVPAATKYMATSWNKNVSLPAYLLAPYYLKSTSPKTDNTYRYTGMVIGFGLVTYSLTAGGTLVVPTLSDAPSGFGGNWEFEGKTGKFTTLNWNPSIQAPGATKMSPAEIAAAINQNYNQISIESIQAMHTANTAKKAKYDTYITAFKTSNSPVKALLTGNAKTFFGV